MPTTRPTKVTIYDQDRGVDKVIGWAFNSGCENDKCVGHICAGKRWHATPADPFATLEENHFRELDQVIYALQAVADS